LESYGYLVDLGFFWNRFGRTKVKLYGFRDIFPRLFFGEAETLTAGKLGAIRHECVLVSFYNYAYFHRIIRTQIFFAVKIIGGGASLLSPDIQAFELYRLGAAVARAGGLLGGEPCTPERVLDYACDAPAFYGDPLAADNLVAGPYLA
jgi:hypothetical protein